MSSHEHAKYVALLDVAEAIASHSDLSTLIRHLASCLPKVIVTDFLALSLYDAERHAMRLHTLQANVQADVIGGHVLAPDELPAGLVWQTQRPLLVPDLSQELRWPNVIRMMREDGIQSFCYVPLTTAARRLGVLGFGSLRKRAFEECDSTFLMQVGKQVAVAVENALNREAASLSKQEAERQRDRFRLLLRITNAMVSKLDLREVFHAVSATVRELVPQEYTCLVLYDETRQQFRLRALDFQDNPGWLFEGFVADAVDSPATIAVSTKRPVAINHLKELERFGHHVIRMLLDKEFKSMCALPLLSDDRAIGCLTFASRQEEAFPESSIEFLMEVAGQIALAVANALAYQEITELKNKLAEEKLYLEEELRTEQGFENIIGDSKALKQLLKQVEVVAPTDATVLIQGETGTGKELIARAIHRLSGRKERTFVKLNCAAIPSGLLESELFGHERGAFTGAISRKVGRFELADKGTIFLDEVGEIPLELQSKLLRVLQEQEFERLGSTRTIRVDVRLIAATNQDLKSLVDAKEFRSDLYYRLNVFPVTMPPLRERREDIPSLVRYFTQQYAGRMKKRIHTVPLKTLEALSRYAWPGNIRELENLVERSVILTKGTELQSSSVNFRLR
ncbi:MAG: sigma 54-interacting transcriptional regulator [Nitrospiraceae bacterium]